MKPADVIVVGAGPVGLLLAGELRLGGASVTVIERLVEPSTASRASTLHARTMELFDQRGLLEEFAGAPIEPRSHFAGLPLDLGQVESRYAGQWKVLQRHTEEVLARWVGRLGVPIRRGVEVVGVDVTGSGTPAESVWLEADGPDGPERFSARYVVGCDGERSVMRTAAGFPVEAIAAGRRLLRADLTGVDVPDRRFHRFSNGVAIAARRPDGVTRVMVCDFDAELGDRTSEPDFTELCNSWKRITGEDITGGDPIWLDAFDDAMLQTRLYRRGPVLLAGDAAHAQLPVGGQALNLGLQDAANLGWKLAAEVTGRAPDGLLDSYHDERHAAGARALASIRSQAQLLFGGEEVDGLRGVIAELLALPDVRKSLAAAVSGVSVRYPRAPSDHPLVGARLPVLDLLTSTGHITTAELLRPGRGLLLLLGGELELAEAAAGWSSSVTVVIAQPSGELLDAAAVLARPDGHIAWARSSAEPGQAPELRAALARWFQPDPTKGEHDEQTRR